MSAYVSTFVGNAILQFRWLVQQQNTSSCVTGKKLTTT